MNTELMEALDQLEREKKISKESLMKAIEDSLLAACKNHFGREDNMHVYMDRETGDFKVIAEKTVVEEVTDPVAQIALSEARKYSDSCKVGDLVHVKINSKEFGRIATMNAKNVILQKIREEERKVLFAEYYSKEGEIVTGVIQRKVGRNNISVNLGRTDAFLEEKEMVKTENYRLNSRMKFYCLKVEDHSRGPKIYISRTHPELVRRLFEQEVTEVRDGIVEIVEIVREAGSRTKMAVWSNDPDVDPVGACVGMNGTRVNAVVNELNGEKIDIINWDPEPARLIENALSPAKVMYVIADNDERKADVVVPDNQLSLAIGKEGQNARLAAHLTKYKIDIKSETQAREAGEFISEDDYYEFEEYGSYDEDYAEEYEGEYEADGAYDDGEIYDDAPYDGEVQADRYDDLNLDVFDIGEDEA